MAVVTCEVALAVPVPRHVLAERLESDCDVIGIVHWGLNTYMDREWGYGDEDPKLLNPMSFDANQIVGACKNGGLKGLVVVAKHHDGFCLWPTKTTEHNILKSPFRNGKGDYVREMSEACRRMGLRFGVYCSPWDRNSAQYATSDYVKIYHAQIRELIDGRYGEIFEMWIDGANGGDGYYGGACERRSIPDGYYDFDKIFSLVRSLQPKACIFTELRDDADFRWPCNEKGILSPDSRATIRPFDVRTYKECGNEGDIDGTVFHPCEADFPLRPGWFCHEAQNADVKTGEYLMKLYLSSVGNGGIMNIGIAPSKDGLLHDGDVRELRRFREIKDEFFKTPVSDGGVCNLIVMSENIRKGERVVRWELKVKDEMHINGKAIGRRRIRLLDELIRAEDCSVVALDANGRNVPVSVAYYRVDAELAKSVRKATDPADAVDQHGNAAFVAQDSKTITCRFESKQTYRRLRFVPDVNKVGGTPVVFVLYDSDDGKAWRRVKGMYRLDNVAANPVPQVLLLEETRTSTFLKVEAVATQNDEPISLRGVSIMALDKMPTK